MDPIPRVEARSTAGTSLVAIQPEGAGAPFFCVPAVGSDVRNYRRLSGHLGGQRFYVLEPQGLDGERAPHDKVEDMAAHYVSEIRSVQPHGPYFLGGASSGGTVAWEMACRLHAEGERVAFFALIDAHYRGHERYLPDPEPGGSAFDTVLARVDYHIGNLVTRTRREQVDYLAALAKKRLRALQERLPLLADEASPPDTLSPVRERVRKANEQAIIDYFPPEYPGKVTLFYTTGESIRQFRDRRLMWNALNPRGMEIHLLDGAHETLLEEPCVSALARSLAQCIRRAAKELETESEQR